MGASASQNGLGAPEGAEPSGLGATPAIPRAVRRTLKPFDSAPKDGTPFHILNLVRFNVAAEKYEVLVFGEDGGREWRFTNFDTNVPTYWLREAPLPYEIPSRDWFTLTYRVFVKQTSRQRIKRFLQSVVGRVAAWGGA